MALHGDHGISVRHARTKDVPSIVDIMQPLVEQRILLGKDLVVLYESVQEFRVAVTAEDHVVGFGALHVLWEHLAEVRSIAVRDDWLGKGVGRKLIESLEKDARKLGLKNLFCLTFEVDFFTKAGFHAMDEGEALVAADVYAELLRSPDEGVAEALDLARVKPNTLGNTRMLKVL
jgi:amino-acid N-acetyltransferase